MEKHTWWKEGVVYQIYPRSFMDSNNDGIGDLQGIISKLDYLKNLGIDIIWLSPIYSSPNDDNGYDISDYKNIMKEFGSLDVFDQLLQEAHTRNIKIIMDLVVNHTSDEHKWFIESSKSEDNPYRDYYIWKKGKDKLPPNNWKSVFSGSSWKYDSKTDMWFMHLFSEKQCDLNWENKGVREKIYEMMRWWGDKGIDGFRMDVITCISKVQTFEDGPICQNFLGDPLPLVANGPRVHEYIKEMNREVISKYDWLTVGEGYGASVEDALNYVGESRDELNMIFSFDHVMLGEKYVGNKWDRKSLDLVELKTILEKWEDKLENKGWNSLYFSNHDQPRSVSRFGNDSLKYRKVSAKMLALCLHMMKGTPYVFQGEELGMTNNYNFKDISQYKDIESINGYKELLDCGYTKENAINLIQKTSRDNARTPMHWSSKENAGFSKVTPWIELNPNYKTINAQDEVNDETSVYNFYKKLIKLRHNSELICYGTFNLLMKKDENIFCYERILDDKKLLVVCNFSNKKLPFVCDSEWENSKLLISNMDRSEGHLKPYEAFVLEL